MKLLIKIVLFLLSTGFSHSLHAANRYWVAAAAGNWSIMANWSATSGGAGGASVPGSGDAAIFNGSGVKNCTIDVTVTIASLNVMAAYTGTIAQGANPVTISGAATFSGGVFSGGSANITITGAFNLSGTLFTSTTAKLEFNSNTVFNSATFIHNNGAVRFNGTGAATPTLSGSSSPSFYILEYAGLAKTYNVTSTGTIGVANKLAVTGSLFCIINSGTFDVTGDIDITNTATGGGGSALINLAGSGVQNFNGASSAGAGVLPQLTINNITGTVNLTGYPGVANNFVYSAGTINPGTSTFCFARGSASSYSITGSPTLNNIAIIAASSTLTLTITGSLTAGGDLGIAGGSNITLNTGTIHVAGDLSLTNTATGGGGSGGIEMNGTGNQVITSTGINGQSRLPDFTINKPSGILTLPSLLTVIGDWTYLSGNLDVSTNNSTVIFTNTLSITGTHTLNHVIFEAVSNRTFTFPAGTLLTVNGTLTTSGSSSITLNSGSAAGTTMIQAQGDIAITNTGSGGGTAGILINGSGIQTFSSSAAAGQGRMPYITIQKPSGTLVLSGIISVSRNWTYTSGVVDAGTNASTVVFGGNNLSVSSAGMNFYHLTVTANTSTLLNSMTVNGDLLINGTGVLAPGANTIHLSGNWTNRGTAGFTEATSTVNFAGTAVQTISTSGSENFTNVIINNNPAGIQLLNNITIGSVLTMTAGMIDLNGNNLTLGLSAANQGTLNYTNGSMINTGSFIRWLRTGTTIAAGSAAGLFPMGTASDKRTFYISAPVTAPTTGGTVAVSYTHSTTNSAVTFADGAAVVLVRKDLNWAVTTANGLAGGSYNLQLQGTGYGTINNLADLRMTLVNGVTGTAGVNGGTTSNPQVNRTGISLANLGNTFYLASVSTANSPLPVTLLNFTARIFADEVVLEWATAAEFNNASFTIQRSADGEHWENILQVAGKGNSTTDNYYKATDPHPLAGSSLYRLVQTDIDGKNTYSGIRQVNLTATYRLRIYPNPATNYITAENSGGEKMNIALFNTNGQRMNIPINYSTDKTVLNVSAITTGSYYLRIEQGNITETKKVLIRK